MVVLLFGRIKTSICRRLLAFITSFAFIRSTNVDCVFLLYQASCWNQDDKCKVTLLERSGIGFYKALRIHYLCYEVCGEFSTAHFPGNTVFLLLWFKHVFGPCLMRSDQGVSGEACIADATGEHWGRILGDCGKQGGGLGGLENSRS